MGKTGQSIGMVLCLVLAVLSQMYSNEINDLFNIDGSNAVDTSAPLIGLQTNESWFVVLVDFESNQLNNDAKEQIESEFQEYSGEYFAQALGQEVIVNITIHDEIIRAPNRSQLTVTMDNTVEIMAMALNSYQPYLQNMLSNPLMKQHYRITISTRMELLIDFSFSIQHLLKNKVLVHPIVFGRISHPSQSPSKTEMFRLNTIRCRPCGMESMDLERSCTK